MNKISSFLLFSLLILFVLGLSGCFVYVDKDLYSMDIYTEGQFLIFMNSSFKEGRLASDIHLAKSEYTVKMGADKTLDLNGKTLTFNGSYGSSLILVKGKLTIKDSSAGGEGSIVNNSRVSDCVTVSSGGKLTLLRGKLKSTYSLMDALKVYGEADIRGGLLEAGDDALCCCRGGEVLLSGATLSGDYGIYVMEGGSVSRISDINVMASSCCIGNYGTITLIESGSYNASNSESNAMLYGLYNEGTISNITGGEFTVASFAGQTAYGFFNKAGSVTAHGGSFYATGAGTKKNVNKAALYNSPINPKAKFYIISGAGPVEADPTIN